MPRTKSAAKQAKQKLTHAELSAIHKAKWAKIRENMAAKKAAAKEALQDTPAASELEVFAIDSIDATIPDQLPEFTEKSVGVVKQYETKTYDDGTVATGIAPLPEQSPSEQMNTAPDPAALAVKTEEAIERQRAKMTDSEKETADKKASAIFEKSKKPKKYTGPKEFSVALKAAESRLAKAIVERAQAAGKLSMLQAEIPSLIQIINALKGQQNIPAAPYDISGSVPNATAFQAPMPNVGFASAGIPYSAQMEADNLAKIQAAMTQAASFPVSKAIGSVQLSPEVLGSLDENDDDDIDKYITGSGMAEGGWIGG